MDSDIYSRVLRFNNSYYETGENIFLILNDRGEVVLINEKGSQLLGMSRDEIRGKNWIENFIPDDDKPRVSNILSEIFTGQLSSHEYVVNNIIGANGILSIKWRNNIIKDNGSGVIATISIGEINGANGNGSQNIKP